MARPYPGRSPNYSPVVDNPVPSGIADARCYILSSGGAYAYPVAGADVHGAMAHLDIGFNSIYRECAHAALPGSLVTIESAAAFSVGAELSVTAEGRVKPKGTGEIAVAVALESAAGSGQIRKCVWTSGRRA